MNATEKVVLENLANILEKSTYKDWERGDIYDWSDHAKDMEVTINNSVGVMRALLSTPSATVENMEEK